MTTQEITSRVSEILQENLGIETYDFDTAKTFRDLGSDSLDDVELIMAIESEFAINISDEEMTRLVDQPIFCLITYIETQLDS